MCDGNRVIGKAQHRRFPLAVPGIDGRLIQGRIGTVQFDRNHSEAWTSLIGQLKFLPVKNKLHGIADRAGDVQCVFVGAIHAALCRPIACVGKPGIGIIIGGAERWGCCGFGDRRVRYEQYCSCGG